ncbi:hypothetical protein HYW20_01560 [Candidatus Woesearchaeota archaeon]|nr:hypothetical protein [Candidatus Woesearchaeota archaeon]
MVKHTKEELIRIIQDYSKAIERTPKMKEVACDRNLPPINRFIKIFGSWNSTLENAGLKINAIGKYDNNYLLKKLVDIKRKVQRNPKLEDLKYFEDSPSSFVYFRRFGSWNNALRLAGLKINVRKDYKKEELLKLLKDKAKELGRSPKIEDLGPKNSMPDKDPYERCFGGFNKALEAAGLEVMYVFRKWTKEEVIKWLKYKYEELGRTPGIRDFDNDSRTPAKNVVRKLFGNWTNALREANIPVRRFLSEKELIVIWKAWQKHCEEMARVIYGNVIVQFKNEVIGVPDIYVPNESLFIEIKTCGYKDFKEQIRIYCS